jgi:hypothetical protein
VAKLPPMDQSGHRHPRTVVGHIPPRQLLQEGIASADFCRRAIDA